MFLHEFMAHRTPKRDNGDWGAGSSSPTTGQLVHLLLAWMQLLQEDTCWLLSSQFCELSEQEDHYPDQFHGDIRVFTFACV